jgi:hypothetical protein
MKNLLLILLVLPIFCKSQIMFDTLSAVAWQNTYTPINTVYGTTAEGHPYVFGINNRYNGTSPLPIQIVVTDIITGHTTYKEVPNTVSNASIYWNCGMDSLGNVYISLVYGYRRVLKVNFKYRDSIIVKDLGNPFYDNSSLPYSMKLGENNNMFFGSSAGNNLWSEYNPYADTFVYKCAIQVNVLDDYVLQITGDSNYVYASTGQRNNTKKLFAVDKKTGISTQLFSIAASSGYQLETRKDGHIYVSEGTIGTWLLDSGKAIFISWTRNAFPQTGIGGKRNDYYEIGDWGQQQVRSFYDLYNDTLYAETKCCTGLPTQWQKYTGYKINSGHAANSIKLLFGDNTNPNGFGYIGNYYGLWFWYDAAQDSAKLLGATNYNIYSSLQNTDSTILFGSYPNGTILEWNKNKAWTANTYFPTGANQNTTYSTNPRIIAEFRTQTPAQFHHAKFMRKIKNLLVVGGDVIRTGNTTSVGAMNLDTYQYWGYDCNKIDRLSMTGMAVWKDSIAMIATSNAYGGTAKIYYYNPSDNTMVDSINLGFTNYAFNAGYNNGFYVVGDTLIGSKTYYEYYKINLKTKQVIQDTSFLYYMSGQLEDNYIWFNTPASGQCPNGNMNSTCNMPTSYMLRHYNKYNGWSFNHIVYNITWDGYSIGRTRGLYPPLYAEAKTSNSFRVYPNPANSVIFLPTGKYRIINILGVEVMRINRTGKNIPIDISKLSIGSYFVINETDRISTKLIIIR